ncbi:unnamed protein product (macronuclear) [Paramecium tetraurelia]|uniref:Uncharacterized protein n=1 Tax=Paramecium tetraurelia TaxID=5888 RepID=A0BZL1_PARTE|nr:uncharacterized protein GSPATT00033831001 [Paramecium tetraurelia]CAK63978.1 unnamed protein product [Paramecium tetraurelia]|eukprot:XP_001431376.1 hypothetical protein (macronuclear) [Paramecium tetraurelia strain d4-2]
MQDSQNLKDLQVQLTKFISRLEELERENKYLKEHVLNQQYQLVQNVKIIDNKYQQMHRKYLKCLYRYGISQSCLTSMISQYNKLIGTEKMDLKQCIDRFGVVYEKDKIINEEEMKSIIKERISKDSEEIQTLFFPNKFYRNECLSEKDSLQACFNNQIKYLYIPIIAIATLQNLYTENSDETIINNLTTQRYLEKLQFDYQNDQTLHYPKTFKVERLLQQSNRDPNTQILTDRSMRMKQERRAESRAEQTHNSRLDVKCSPQKQLNLSINEDRVKRFDNHQENEVKQQRRRSRAERLNLQP